MSDQLSDAERERLCQALGFKVLSDWLDEEAVSLRVAAEPMVFLPDFESSDFKVTEFGTEWECCGCRTAMGDGDTAVRLDMGRTYVCAACFVAYRGERWPPIDTDPAWAVRAMEATCERIRYLEFLVSKGDGGWLVYFKREGNIHGFGSTYPLALCRAMLAALEAGELA